MPVAPIPGFLANTRGYNGTIQGTYGSLRGAHAELGEPTRPLALRTHIGGGRPPHFRAREGIHFAAVRVALGAQLDAFELELVQLVEESVELLAVESCGLREHDCLLETLHLVTDGLFSRRCINLQRAPLLRHFEPKRPFALHPLLSQSLLTCGHLQPHVRPACSTSLCTPGTSLEA